MEEVERRRWSALLRRDHTPPHILDQAEMGESLIHPSTRPVKVDSATPPFPLRCRVWTRELSTLNGTGDPSRASLSSFANVSGTDDGLTLSQTQGGAEPVRLLFSCRVCRRCRVPEAR